MKRVKSRRSLPWRDGGLFCHTLWPGRPGSSAQHFVVPVLPSLQLRMEFDDVRVRRDGDGVLAHAERGGATIGGGLVGEVLGYLGTVPLGRLLRVRIVVVGWN
jgi:hypothetical protein